MKKLMLFTVGTIMLSLLAVCPLVRKLSFSHSSNPGNPHEIWDGYYDKKCSQVLNKIQKAFKFSADEIKSIGQQLDYLRSKDPLFNAHLKPSIKAIRSDPLHPLTQKTVNLLRARGLNPEAVDIIINNKHHSPASARQSYLDSPETFGAKITLNIEKLQSRSHEIQEAILRHEITHLIKYDSLEEGYLISMMRQKGFNEDNWHNHPAMIEFRHLKELRADQLGAISGGASIARAFKIDLTTSTINTESNTHPSSHQRAAHMNVVLNHLNQPHFA